MDDSGSLAAQFEAHRAHLRAVAYRMLGSSGEAEDAVQDAWLRLSRSDTSEVENLGGWLTTVVSRICLNVLQSRKTRRESPLDPALEVRDATVADPADDAVLADSVGAALQVVLDTLAPAERLAFVLHDLFAVSFPEIASIIGREPAAARQLASRARRRVQGGSPDGNPARQREVVEAFLAASRGGDFAALLALLDPDVVVRADGAAVTMGADAELRGASQVAEAYAGRAKAARPILIDGEPGLVWSLRGVPQVIFDFTVVGDRIVTIELLADPDLLGSLELARLGPKSSESPT
jgi:RNA polymerase sigma-70 factor (ECF subfamily)